MENCRITPEYSTIIIARKPCEGSCIDNILKYGVGGINIDECRISTNDTVTNHSRSGDSAVSKGIYGDSKAQDTFQTFGQRLGRFPANVILSYDDETKDEVIGGMPDGGKNGSITKRYEMNNQVYGDYGSCNLWEAYDDDGSAARYFYNAQETERDQEYIKYEVKPMENQEEQQKIHLYSEGKNYNLYQGNMLEMLDVIEPNSIDAVVTDPPYELNFMNKGWDRSGIAFQVDTWEKCYRVLKPGGYLLAFGGSRTHHRITCAIEDAGFEIRDCIMYLFGSGFPKSMNIAKGIEAKEQYGKAGTSYKRMVEQSGDGEEYTVMQTNNGAMGELYEATRKEYTPTSEDAKKWDGWGTQLKPAYEAIVVARKPCEGSCIENVLQYGVGGINIEECRVGTGNGNVKPEYVPNNKNNVYGAGLGGGDWENTNGRFPANVILSYDDDTEDEVIGGMPITTSTGGNGEASTIHNFKNVYGDYKAYDGAANLGGLGDTGSAARYFYCAKATTRDRDEGLVQFNVQKTGDLQGGRKEDSAGSLRVRADGSIGVNPFAGNGSPKRNTHPCVKPTDLMSYLVRLVTPKGGIVLDPFNGSGSTGKAVMYENKDRNANYTYIGIELNAEYLAISDARIKYAATVNEVLSKPSETKQKIANNQMNLFDLPN